MALQIIILFITFFTVISDAPFRFFNSTASTVIVYSATGGGVVAAIAAARSGSSVTLIGATGGGGTGNHIGGMVTGGLQHTDCGNASVIGGITREFFIRVEKQYPNRSTDPGLQPCTGPPCWLFEAHVAERVMYEMLEEANVDVITGQEGIANVTLIDKRVTLLTTLTGRTFKADVFIDASYEGDLLAAAGATMTFGRESKDQYDEKGAGVQPIIEYDQLPSGINPFWSNGEALPLITTTKPFLPVGSADDNLESYSYRLCMTRSPSRRIPITQPLNYNSSTFELFRRIFAASPSVSRNTFLVCLGPIPSLNTSDCPNDKSTRWCKCDMISGGALGTDLPGGSYGYANASVENRRLIAQAHADYVAGVIWFLTHDTFVPVSIRNDMADYGLCADEFLDTTPTFFPHQLYVREARRLVGDFVLTQNRPLPLFENRSIGLGSYAFDAHTVQRGIRINNKGNAEAINEGEIVSQPPAYQASYRIPYDTLLPSPSELLNVLAAVPVSASHVVFTSLRMEPTWMIIGHAAGIAASMAASDCESNVHSVNVSSLQETLVASGQLIIE